LGYKENKSNDDDTAYLDGFADKQYEKAIECFDKAIETDPNFSPAFFNKGYVLICQRSYEEALEWVNKAINLDPKNTYTRNYRGYARLGLKLYDEAIRDFDKAIELDPKTNADAWNYKGMTICFSSKRKDESVQCFDKAINITKKHNENSPIKMQQEI
jgi:tetratricopeptide (TPR) repeat protein